MLQPYLALFDSTLNVGVAISNLDVCFQFILAVQNTLFYCLMLKACICFVMLF